MSRPDIHGTRRTWRQLLVPGGIFCLALAVRLIHASRVWIHGRLLPESPDPYFHLHLIRQFATGHGSLPLFEPLLNPPHGALLYWPPGFDAALSLVARLLLWMDGSWDAAALALGLSIPLMGAVAVWVLWSSVRRIGLKPVHAAALVLMAVVSYALVEATRFGRVDHQAMELLGWCVFLWLFVRIHSVDSDQSRSDSQWMGALLGLSLIFWNGALVVIGLVHAAFFFHAVAQPDPESALKSWKTVAWWSLPFSLLSVLVTGTWLQIPVSSVYLSFFHVAACVVPLGFVMIWSAATRRWRGVRVKWVMLGLAGVALVAGLFLSGSAVTDVLWRRDLNAALVPESDGLMMAYRMGILFQPLIFPAPFLIMGLVVVARKQATQLLTGSLAGLLTLTLLLSLLQIRFLPLMEPVSLLAAAILLREVSHRRAGSPIGVTVALWILVALPVSYLSLMRRAEAGAFPLMKAVLPVMSWMKSHTGLDEPVLSPVWGYGHYVVCLAERPTVSSAFGATPVFERGIRASLLSTFVANEDQLVRIMADTGAKLLLLPDMSMLREAYRRAWKRAGMPPLPVHTRYELDRLFTWNNGHTDKLEGTSTGAVHLRLIYNGPYRVDGKTAFRVFERVRGAIITGRVPDPAGYYLAAMVLVPSYGTPVLWRMPIRPGSDGGFSFPCPYNTSRNGDVKAVSLLEIWDLRSRSVICRTAVTESDVRAGHVLAVQEVRP